MSPPSQAGSPAGEPGPDATALQAALFDFSLGELVRQHRDSFPPLWSTESWSKLLIWLALNCGCSAETAELEAFAVALGPVVSGRMRRLFFERELSEANLKLMADPAERQVLALPLEPLHGSPNLALDGIAAALEQVGLAAHVVADRSRWQRLDAVVVVPWLDEGQHGRNPGA